MFRSYLTVAIRNLMRQKVYSLINVVGLAVGLSSVILIGLFISYELSYDSYHADVERKYRVIREMRPPGKQPWADMKVTPGLAPVLKNEYPEVESSARVVLQNLWVKSGERVFEHTVCVADSTIFDILTIPLVNADWRVVLSGRNTIVRSESMAAKYFPDEDPIGQTLSLEDNMMGGLFTVSGVMKNLPMNSSFRFDLLTLSVPPRTALAQVWNVFHLL